jgi:hypothetical protein
MIASFIRILIIVASISSAIGCSSNKSVTADAGSSTPPKPPAKKIKPYAEVITKEAVSDTGLFTVHRIDDKYFYEIPKNRLGQEFLLVSRIAKTPQIGYGGEENDVQVVRWERKGDKVLLRTVSYENVAADSFAISRAVRAANFEEVIRSFPIAALNKDSSSVVIEVTDLFTSDVGILAPGRGVRQQAKITMLDKDRSFVEYIRSFPTNIEVENVLTFNADQSPQNPSSRTASFTMHHSMVELPNPPMVSRLADPRVGFFSLYQTDFGRPETEAVTRQYILRWRLEPKDTAAFLRGELVEPIKPITWYIDPATPEQWRPWLKNGVEWWNEAFEAAGFKNAIRCIDPPTPEEDPEWSPEDARYSVIRYYPSTIENAYGPNIHDPRTGEIIESDIGWFHNIVKLLSGWYFTQAVADPRARTLPLPDSIIGQFVAYVAAHEVGHTLGLPHNMKASNAYPTDSLRSPSFTQKYGTTPTIMDYARANYVAQPGDGVTQFLPRIGPYDKHVIRWGYRPIIGAKTPDDELDTLRAWARAAESDKMLRFGAQQWNTVDPTAQMEDLGDDAIKSTTYGLKNLRFLMTYLYDAVAKDGESFRQLGVYYDYAVGQFRREIGHVAALVGGVEIERKVFGVAGPQYTPLPKARMREAVAFLHENIFTTPTWILDPRIIGVLYPSGSAQRLADMQTSTLRSLVSDDKLLRLIDIQARTPAEAYTISELYADVEGPLFRELQQRQPSDFYRRALQRAWVETLITKATEPNMSAESMSFARFFGIPMVYNTDVRAISRQQLSTLLKRLKGASTPDVMTQAHWQDLALQIERALNPNR